MHLRRQLRRFAAALAVGSIASGVIVVVPAASVGAQTVDDPGSDGPSGQRIPRPVLTGQCVKPEQGKELYGPTDVNAQAGNQGLSVAFNSAGTVTVFKWPSPSYYDQVKYHTNSRAEPYAGAQPNEGAFLGLVVTTGAGQRTVWLRDFPLIEQRHAEGITDELHTTYRDDELGIAVTVTDVVAHPDDVLVRDARVELLDGSPVMGAALVAYENFNLVVSKHPAAPSRDWCEEGLNVDAASYDADADAIVHHLDGIDESTGAQSTVAVAMGFDGPSDSHQVGGDAYEPLATPDGKVPGPTQDAYDDVMDGDLTGNVTYAGQTTGVLTHTLDLRGGAARARVLIGAAATATEALELLDAHRDVPTAALAAAKRRWFNERLAGFPLPATDDPFVLGVSRRALAVLLTDIDRRTKAIVASITTQAPYGEDWPRDGAFFDYVLDLGGLHDLVTDHHGFYAETQQTVEDPDPYLTALGVPPGNWGMNYYADGVVGGPIPWEIDETGYAVWNFWQHHLATGDIAALRAIWPTLSAAADFLVSCADPTNGLQCRAIEDDNPDLRQTNVGASATWMAMEAASAAASALGEDAAAERYAARRDELGAAIDEHLWDEEQGAYGPGAAAVTVWPACFHEYDHPRMQRHLDHVWETIAPTFAEPEAGEKEFGLYEAKGVLSLAKAWKGDPAKMDQLRDALRWIVTQHATTDTHVMGEVWQVEDGEVRSIQSQPHAWEQILTYMAAIELYPPVAFADVEPGCEGVLGAMRTARSSTAVPPSPTPRAATPPSSPHELPATGSDAPVAGLAVLAAALGLAIRHRSNRPIPTGDR
jgi:hypothetical protein